MTAIAMEQIITSTEAEPCPNGCGADLVYTKDAIGRLRGRCPKCAGVSKRSAHHVDDVFVPQSLVRTQTRSALPPVLEGQLRCQRCANGVDGGARFCGDVCSAAHAEAVVSAKKAAKLARGEERGAAFAARKLERKQAKDARERAIADARLARKTAVAAALAAERQAIAAVRKTATPAAKKASGAAHPKGKAKGDMRTCRGCGAQSPRLKGQWATTSSCEKCR